VIVKERDKLRVSVRVWVSRLPVTVRAPKETCVHSIWSSTRSVCSFTTDGGGRVHNPLPRNLISEITHNHSYISQSLFDGAKTGQLTTVVAARTSLLRSAICGGTLTILPYTP